MLVRILEAKPVRLLKITWPGQRRVAQAQRLRRAGPGLPVPGLGGSAARAKQRDNSAGSGSWLQRACLISRYLAATGKCQWWPLQRWVEDGNHLQETGRGVNWPTTRHVAAFLLATASVLACCFHCPPQHRIPRSRRRWRQLCKHCTSSPTTTSCTQSKSLSSQVGT